MDWDGHRPPVLPRRLAGNERNESAHEIDLTPFEHRAIAKPQTGVDADGEENAHFALQPGHDAPQLLDRQLTPPRMHLAALLDAVPDVRRDLRRAILDQDAPHHAEVCDRLVARGIADALEMRHRILLGVILRHRPNLPHLGMAFAHEVYERTVPRLSLAKTNRACRVGTVWALDERLPGVVERECRPCVLKLLEPALHAFELARERLQPLSLVLELERGDELGELGLGLPPVGCARALRVPATFDRPPRNIDASALLKGARPLAALLTPVAVSLAALDCLFASSYILR